MGLMPTRRGPSAGRNQSEPVGIKRRNCGGAERHGTNSSAPPQWRRLATPTRTLTAPTHAPKGAHQTRGSEVGHLGHLGSKRAEIPVKTQGGQVANLGQLGPPWVFLGAFVS